MPYSTKLKDSVVVEAADLHARGESYLHLADAEGVHKKTLARAVRRFRCGIGVAYRRSSPQTVVVPDDAALVGYLAGLVDGEGSIITTKEGVILQVVNTNKPVIDFLSVTFGGNVTSVDHGKYPNRGQRKTLYMWRHTRRRDALALIRAIELYLVIKKAKARDAIVRLEGLIAREGTTSDWAHGRSRVEYAGKKPRRVYSGRPGYVALVKKGARRCPS